MPRKSRLLLFLAAVVWPTLISQEVMAQGPNEIVWLDEAKTQAFLIPESAFAKLDWSDPGKTDLSGLGMTQAQQQLLRTLLMDRLKSNLPFECDPGPSGSTVPYPGAPVSSTSLAELLRQDSIEVAVLGEVVRRIPVWNAPQSQPGHREFVRIERVLKAPASRHLEAGFELSRLLHFGLLTVGPAQLCLEPPRSWREEPAFNRVLMLAAFHPLYTSHVHVWGFFEVRDGLILPAKSWLLLSHKPYPLEDLVRDVSAKPQGEE